MVQRRGDEKRCEDVVRRHAEACEDVVRGAKTWCKADVLRGDGEESRRQLARSVEIKMSTLGDFNESRRQLLRSVNNQDVIVRGV